MTHPCVIDFQELRRVRAKKPRSARVDPPGYTATQRRALAMLSQVAATASVSSTAQALGVSESTLRFELGLVNNLSERCLARLGGNGDRDHVELTNAGYEVLPAWIASSFDRFLAAPTAWPGPFRGFHRHRALMNRLVMKIAARNRLYGRVGALRLKPGHVDVVVDLGAGQSLIAAVDLPEFQGLGLRTGVELGCLIAPEDVLLAVGPSPGPLAGNALDALVSAHQDFAGDGVVLELAGGKSLVAQLGDDEASALQLQAESPVWAVISPYAVTLTLDALEPRKTRNPAGPAGPEDDRPGAGPRLKPALIPLSPGSAMGTGTLTYESLMAHAREPNNPVTRALAGAMASAAAGHIEAPNLALGLSRPRYTALLAQHFPGAQAQTCACGEACREGCRPLRGEEFQDLVELLLNYRSNEDDATEWLAYAIASACMGGNHLYQDMGLPNRQALSDLLKQHFIRLFEKNPGNMKWKKFFYKQLCDQAQVRVCQAPSCQVCDDYLHCFGPEDDRFAANLTASAGPLGAAT